MLKRFTPIFVATAFLAGCDPQGKVVVDECQEHADCLDPDNLCVVRDCVSNVCVVKQNTCVDPVACGPQEEACPVPGGTFRLDNDAAYSATVSSFRMDRNEVTVGKFRGFVEAWVDGWRPEVGAGKHSHLNNGQGALTGPNTYESGWRAEWSNFVGARSKMAVEPTSGTASSMGIWSIRLSCNPYGGQTWTETTSSNDDLPQNCLSWYDLYAYCIWDGGFLPTEAEWEYTATGGVEYRTWPWGNVEPTSEYATFSSDRPDFVGLNSKGLGKWGQADMAGNVAEWTLDWHHSPYATDCQNCSAQEPDLYRSVRGGSYFDDARVITTTFRSMEFPAYRDVNVGGRCARPSGQ